MEAFYSWIKNIAFFILLVTMVMHVLPNQKYEKYIRFFTGIVMVILVVNPIFQVMKKDQILADSFIQNSYKQEMDGFEKEIAQADGEQKQSLVSQYEKQIEDKISEMVTEQGLYTSKISVTLDTDSSSEKYGTIARIQIEASRQKVQEKTKDIHIDDIKIGKDKPETASVEEINLKNKIEDFYNISGDNINISIQG